MREELVCVHALVQGLAEIRVNKQHIVTHPPTLTLPGSGKAQGAETENILVHRAGGTQRPAWLWLTAVTCFIDILQTTCGVNALVL